MIDRRRFLQVSLYSVASLLSPSFPISAISKETVHGGRPKKVIVLGAGLAGLSAAFELQEAGHEVTVIEARSRPGGRVYTLREAFPDGLYAEAGGQYFYPDDPDYALSYIQRFGLEIVAIQQTGRSRLCYFRDKRIRCPRNAETQWPLDLTAEEKRLGLSGMREKYVWPTVEEFYRTSDSCSPKELLEKYDSRTFVDILREFGASPDAIDLLRIIDWDFIGEGSTNTSALELMRDRAKFSQFKKPFYSVKGGNDLLPKEFAQRLSDRIHYGAAATAIEHDSQSVRIIYRKAGDVKRIAGDYAICAIPFSVLKHLETSPPFSPEKRRAISELPYTSVARVYFLTRTKPWLEEGLTGLAATDLPIIYFWDSTWAQKGTRGILQAYAMGSTARRMAAMDSDERILFALEQTERVFPGIKEFVEGGVSQCWDSDPWALGGYSWLKPGTVRSVVPHISKSEGRIYFAGEHTTPCFRHATMQGALESGIKAAKEIDAAL